MATDVKELSDSLASCSGRPYSPRLQQLSTKWLEAKKIKKSHRQFFAAARSLLGHPSQEIGTQPCTTTVSCSKGADRDSIADWGALACCISCCSQSQCVRHGLVLAKSCSRKVVSFAAAAELFQSATPNVGFAAESLPSGVFGSFLDNIDRMGELAPVFFVASVIGAEMVPLFPTQPLIIASGLLFGTYKGAALALLGTSSAAILAFQVSRTFGRSLAERVAAEEITDQEKRRGLFSRVQKAIDSGSFQQQLVAVTLLRLTPVVPFSASNYLLGATPLKFGAYLMGSVFGLSVWCAVFATLGGASRDVLRSGLSADVLLERLAHQAGAYTEDAAVVVAVVTFLGFVTLRVSQYFGGSPSGDEHKDDYEKV